jgi:hypothetical protein
MITVALVVVLFVLLAVALLVAFSRELPDGLAYRDEIPAVVVQQEEPTIQIETETAVVGLQGNAWKAPRRQYRSRKNKRRSTGGWSGAVAL